MPCDNLERWNGAVGGVSKGGDISTHVADSLCGTSETNDGAVK